jgi:cobaltochelatase CobT
MSQKTNDENDEIKRSIMSTVRAIAQDKNLNVTFSGKQTVVMHDEIKLPSLSTNPSSSEITDIRAASDRAALYKKYHETTLHQSLSPLDPRARAIFDAFENARHCH